MTRAVPHTGGVPRWKAIYDWLRAELDKYEYGSDFYTASDLCERFGVSSITAVRSLNELASEGLIERIQGKGSVVRRVQRQAFIRMVTPAGHHERELAFDSVRSRLIEGVRQAAQLQGLEVGTICESHLSSLFPREGEPTGFLLLRPHRHETIDFLRSHALPYVLIDPIDGCKQMPHARLDRVQAGYLAARHLLELGHRRIGWITGPISRPNFRDRVKGYRNALREAGIPFKWNLIAETAQNIDGTVTAAACEAALDELLELRRPPTAVITGDDSRAIHLLNTCRRRGIDVPAQLSVLGYPNYSESTLTDPPLTVIDGCYEKTSEAAVKLLLEQILQQAAPSKQAELIEARLVERASTAPPPNLRR